MNLIIASNDICKNSFRRGLVGYKFQLRILNPSPSNRPRKGASDCQHECCANGRYENVKTVRFQDSKKVDFGFGQFFNLLGQNNRLYGLQYCVNQCKYMGMDVSVKGSTINIDMVQTDLFCLTSSCLGMG
eukprot:TRINITY_DN15693_c0_g1_i1.p2 TRINITY_DN15693_c0_g1~~TRINITY_DN15693_c0_g1_i1.p2  ORF type:complete len:130 (-),score=5.19 TRINITY_DN15693_c0_g1_i1:243-632(-)